VLNMMMLICRRSLLLVLHCVEYDDDVQEKPGAGAA
jgi:hypothetical protein